MTTSATSLSKAAVTTLESGRGARPGRGLQDRRASLDDADSKRVARCHWRTFNGQARWCYRNSGGPAPVRGTELNKEIVKQTMRSLEACDLQTAREKYLEYVGSARLDRRGPIEDDEQGQAELASDLSDALDGTTRSPTRFQNIGDGLRAEEQGRMKRSGDARRTAFHYCRVDRQVCARWRRDMRISTQIPMLSCTASAPVTRSRSTEGSS